MLYFNIYSSVLQAKIEKMIKHKSHYHCVYNLKYHLVLVTKYRKKCFTAEMLQRLEQMCRNLCTMWEIELIEFGGEADHAHLLLDMHPNIMPSKFINNLKTVSSRLLRKEFALHLQQYYWKPTLWTRAYCLISAGGAPLDIIKTYIQNQQTPD
jgi:putative transposase